MRCYFSHTQSHSTWQERHTQQIKTFLFIKTYFSTGTILHNNNQSYVQQMVTIYNNELKKMLVELAMKYVNIYYTKMSTYISTSFGLKYVYKIYHIAIV